MTRLNIVIHFQLGTRASVCCQGYYITWTDCHESSLSFHRHPFSIHNFQPQHTTQLPFFNLPNLFNSQCLTWEYVTLPYSPTSPRAYILTSPFIHSLHNRGNLSVTRPALLSSPTLRRPTSSKPRTPSLERPILQVPPLNPTLRR